MSMLVMEASDHSDVPQSNMSGYLHKKATNGEWQKRYFEINGSYLTYYKSQKMSKLLAALSIPQVGAIKMLGPTELGVEFRIDIKDRQYILRASTQKEAELWVSTLVKVRDGAGISNPMSSQSHSRTSSIGSQASSSTTTSATVQKAKRSDCMGCIARMFGL